MDVKDHKRVSFFFLQGLSHVENSRLVIGLATFKFSRLIIQRQIIQREEVNHHHWRSSCIK